MSCALEDNLVIHRRSANDACVMSHARIGAGTVRPADMASSANWAGSYLDSYELSWKRAFHLDIAARKPASRVSIW